MAAKTISITFEGYILDDDKEYLPGKSGIYCVYACVENSNNTLSIKKLIYIGESKNIRERLDDHEHYEAWKRHISKGQKLCYTSGLVSNEDRERCEAAMIFKHNPPVNEKSISGFEFDETTINLSGDIKFLAESFTVQRT